jgi:hypothetical protein
VSKDKKKGKKHKDAAEYERQQDAEEVTVAVLVEAEEQDEQNGSDVSTLEDLEPDAPAIFTPALEGDYSAAFAEELTDAAFLQEAFLAQLPLSALFAHRGRAQLTAEGIDFEGLAHIPFSALLSVRAHTDRVYHRYYAGLAALGGRGGHSHILTGGEPFVITFQDGEQRRTLYALLDWPFFLALSKDKSWRKAVGGILPAKEKKSR